MEYWSEFDFGKPASAMKNISFQTTSTHDEKHGRIEDRDYAISDDVAWLIKRHPLWKTIKSIGMVESSREIKGVATTERRYFVSSLPADAKQFAHAVRAHWGIENSANIMCLMWYLEKMLAALKVTMALKTCRLSEKTL
jgi:predicted transposase YbfD/YdcC